MDAGEFVSEYFVNPIIKQESYAPYNAFNTIVYAAIGLAAALLLYRFLSKRLKMDEGFFFAVLSFTVFGGSLRVLEDAHALPRVVEVAGISFFPFVTPGIYVLTAVLLLGSIGLGLFLKKRAGIEVNRTVAAIGILLSLCVLAFALPMVKNGGVLLVVPVLALAGPALLEAVSRAKKRKLGAVERAAVYGQCLDGSATFYAVSFLGYGEQHIVANAIFDNLGGPIAFFAIKILLSIAIVWLASGEMEKEEERNYLLLVVAVIGFAPGIRDILRAACGV